MSDLQAGTQTPTSDGCPYIVTNGTTSHCSLAESGMQALAAKAEAGKALYEAGQELFDATMAEQDAEDRGAFGPHERHRLFSALSGWHAALARWEAIDTEVTAE